MATQEDQPTGQGDNQQTRSLVVRSEQTSLANVAETPFLQQVGFSPLLGQRLARLNETITSRAAKLRKVKIEMVPGETPLITTHLDHGTGYRVFIESTGKKANLTIRTRTEDGLYTPLGLPLVDVKSFLESAFPEAEVRLHQYLKYGTEWAEHKDDLDIDFRNLTEEEINEIIHPNKEDPVDTHGEVDLRINGKKGTAVLRFNINDQWDYRFTAPDIRRRPLFYLVLLGYDGKPEEVEQMIDVVSPLFDKPEYYAGRFDDPWLSDPNAKPTEHLL
ncbi:MAG: hypothetical protein UU21_C0001G0013 [Candidatus Levybacteria bacterium GW2011_GWA2_40_8]|nr:MAG: hypothetical protein UU21_C0001G0013 [Candidatus Levybacteria bacterium GW2011_GWA2_40_8]